MAKAEMVWDLSQLVEDTSPEAIKRQLEASLTEAEQIREKYLGKIPNLDAKGLLQFIELRDAAWLRCEGPIHYCLQLYWADSTSEVAKELLEAVRRAQMKRDQALAFVDVELAKLLKSNPSLIQDPVLAEYKHFLEIALRRAPHVLSEAEEQVVITKDKNGVNGWQLLQSDWLSTRTFEIEIEGKKETLPYGKIISLYHSPDRDLRKRANQTVYENLGRDDIVWASAIRAVCDDHLQMCRLRKYPAPMTQSLIANDVDQQTADSLMRTIEKNAPVYQRYLSLKAKLMGLKRLANYDIVAPLPNAPEMKYDWQRTRMEALETCGEFDGELANWVKEMFEKRHIDAEVRKGKQSGAWCISWLAGKSAYILQSFNEKLSDVFTLVHELGHAVHAYLGARNQKPSNLDFGSCIAETGSVFGELLLTDRLLSKAKTREEKQAILAHVLDEFGMTAFQVSARVFFEQSMYDALQEGKFLDGETVAALWIAGRNKIYGDSVDWLDIMKWEWTMKPHYYLANYRFYNYPYVYAQLFVFALYKLYREQGKAFVPKLKAILAAGSSKSPRDIASELGFDITNEAFWQKGIDQAKEFIDQLENIA